MVMRRLLGVALAATLVVSACGSDKAGTEPGTNAPAGSGTDPGTTVLDASGTEPGTTVPGRSGTVGTSIPSDTTVAAGGACTSFANEGDDTHFWVSFGRNGLTFESVDKAFDLFANANSTTNTIALQFGNGGLRVTLPAEASKVTMHVGSFATDLVIEALAADDTSQGQLTLPGDNTIHEATFTGSITTLTLTGGNNEGALVDICTWSG